MRKKKSRFNVEKDERYTAPLAWYMATTTVAAIVFLIYKWASLVD